MTRARDELYVCGYKIHRDSPENSWYRLVEEAVQSQGILRAVDSLTIFMPATWPRSGVEWNSPVLPKVSQELPDWLFKSPDIVHKGGVRPTGTRRGVESNPAVARGRAIHKILQDLPGMSSDAGLNFARRVLARTGLMRDWLKKSLASLRIRSIAIFSARTARRKSASDHSCPSASASPNGLTGLWCGTTTFSYSTIRPTGTFRTRLTPNTARHAARRLCTEARASLWRQSHPGRHSLDALPRLEWISDEILGKAIANMDR